MKNLLYWLLCGTRGGPTRTRILDVIKQRPENANKLAEMLNLDYKTVRHHLDVLLKHNVIIATGENYSKVYSLSETMLANMSAFNDICSNMKKTYKPVRGLY